MDVWIGATDWPRQEGAIRGAAITRITCYSKLAIGLELVTQRVQQVVGADPDTCQSRPRIRCAPNYSRQKGVMLDASNRNLGIGPDARVREKWSTGVHVWGRKTRGEHGGGTRPTETTAATTTNTNDSEGLPRTESSSQQPGLAILRPMLHISPTPPRNFDPRGDACTARSCTSVRRACGVSIIQQLPTAAP